MDYKQVEHLAHLQKRINDLRSKIPSGIAVSVSDDVSVYDDAFYARYDRDEVTLRRRGYATDSTVLPTGMTFECLGNRAKEYLLFTNGAGKAVNYLIPTDGLTVKRLGANKYHAVNPIQDYIIEHDADRLKEQRVELEKFKTYVKTMWHMLERPQKFESLKEKAWVSTAWHDSSKWYDFVIMHRFITKVPMTARTGS